MISLTTQCPHCQTQFEVHASELQRRKGLVRCVHCAHIFDGYEAIVGDSSESIALPVEPSIESVPEADFEVEGVELDEFIIPDIELEADGDEPIVFHPEEFTVDASEPTLTATEQASERPYRLPIAAAPTIYRERKITPAQEPTFWHSLKGGLMRLLILFLVLLACAQLVYVFRAQIALYAPFTRPALQSVCAQFGCEVPYLRDLSAVHVIYSRLALEDTEAGSNNEDTVYHYALRLGLRNEANEPQEWPTLFVTFNDASATIMARMEIKPEQYLEAWQQQGPFLPGQTVDIQLDVNAQAKKINGFKIEKFFS